MSQPCSRGETGEPRGDGRVPDLLHYYLYFEARVGYSAKSERSIKAMEVVQEAE